jgi:hypothetical protein
MEQMTKRLVVVLPWLVILAGLLVFTLYDARYREGPNPFKTQLIKESLVSAMRIHLHEGTEAEKNAVLALTDSASQEFAAKARQSADRVDSNLKELESLIRQENLPQQMAAIDDFNSCWSQYRTLDETILDLAVQNTNLKAQEISASECAHEIARLEEYLHSLIRRNADDRQCNKVVKPSYEALDASLNIYALHKPHIDEASDEEMAQIERRIKAYDELARKALGSLRGMGELGNDEDLKSAETAYQRFMDLTGEVLRFSRLNTNIKSAELSVGKQRIVAAQCQAILATLQDTVESQRFKATK